MIHLCRKQEVIMKREVEKELIEWKEQEERTPLNYSRRKASWKKFYDRKLWQETFSKSPCGQF